MGLLSLLTRFRRLSASFRRGRPTPSRLKEEHGMAAQKTPQEAFIEVVIKRPECQQPPLVRLHALFMRLFPSPLI